MPKLSLKETKEEREEKEWRRLRKAARKASRYHVDDTSTASTSTSRKRRHRDPPPNSTANSFMYTSGNHGWTPPSTSTKLDADDDFQAKLFDAMEMDSGQDSAQAWFNSYVPPRWRQDRDLDIDSDPIAGPSTLQSLGDEDYAEYMRRGMWERTHKAEHDEQERRKTKAKERRQQEKDIRLKTKRLEAEENERRRRKRDGEDQRKFMDGWNAYQERWSDLQKSATASTLVAESLDFGDLPWPAFPPPVSPDALHKDSISTFLLSERHSVDKTRKQRLREAFLLYHPDRFEGKFMASVREKDRRLVKDAAGRIVRALNSLSEDTR